MDSVIAAIQFIEGMSAYRPLIGRLMRKFELRGSDGDERDILSSDPHLVVKIATK